MRQNISNSRRICCLNTSRFLYFSVAGVIADVLSVVLFFSLLSYAVTIALFLFDLELAPLMSFASFGLMISLTNLLTQIVLYCTSSENLTYDLIATGDLFYDSTWFQLPIKLQKLYLLPIQRSRKEFRLNGRGIIECSLRVFAAVRN